MGEITILTDKVAEEGTAVVNMVFKDEDGNAVTPKAGSQWSLFDASGNVINSRQDVDYTEASDVDIALSGDDLAFQSGETDPTDDDCGVRYFLIKGTYDSNAGNDLPFTAQAKFQIADFVGVT